jgi:hypothetical protein
LIAILITPRPPVALLDFAGPVIRRAAQRNEIGLAEAFIDLHYDEDVPTAFIPVVIP